MIKRILYKFNFTIKLFYHIILSPIFYLKFKNSFMYRKISQLYSNLTTKKMNNKKFIKQ